MRDERQMRRMLDVLAVLEMPRRLTVVVRRILVMARGQLVMILEGMLFGHVRLRVRSDSSAAATRAGGPETT